jgi:uncharacterized protein YheU (UPF0270 family)
MVISSSDGAFQASYWRDAARIGEAPDGTEYSDYLMELKDRIQKLLRRRAFAYAAIFRWNAEADNLVEEYALRDGAKRGDHPAGGSP